jgi:hypothetical protein
MDGDEFSLLKKRAKRFLPFGKFFVKKDFLALVLSPERLSLSAV